MNDTITSMSESPGVSEPADTVPDSVTSASVDAEDENMPSEEQKDDSDFDDFTDFSAHTTAVICYLNMN